ncbi:MAG: PA0069 family radical SAM protein [Deltaproteobacteria bacterium]|nr:PA0069 family radical SAM protein [Deltaproteobacteria bacterium]
MASPVRLRVVSNPPNRFHQRTIEFAAGPPELEPRIFEESAREILSENDSPDIPFRYSLNPYRGCGHACAYCYARPTHEYLDLGAGTDFDTQLVVKPDAPRLLAATFARRSWTGELIAFSGNTDPYQPIEARYGLTRACLEVCADHQNPVGLITKSALVERDVDVLARLHEEAFVAVRVSIPFWSEASARKIEPGAPTPRRRVAAIRTLASAGVPVGVNVAPIIPALNDHEAPMILEAAREAGARFYGRIMVRLPSSVRPVFEERIATAFPDRASRILHAIEDCRAGRRNDPRPFHRMRGEGERWRAIEALIDASAKRLGYEDAPEPPARSTFRRPQAQGELFG